MSKTTSEKSKSYHLSDDRDNVIEAGNLKDDPIAKSPEKQTIYNAVGETVPDELGVTSTDDQKEVHLNHVGQKVDTSIKDADTYLTPDGKTMFVQMEEADQVFAGEHGKNAKWYPKKVVDTWAKKTASKKEK